MYCSRCGAVLHQTGQCGTCGQPAAPAPAYAVPAAPQGWPTEVAGVAPQPGWPAQPYAAPPVQPYGTPPPYMVVPQPGYAMARETGKAFSITAFAFAAVALVFVPILFGIIATIVASVAKKRGERWAGMALKAAIASAGIGIVLGVIVRTAGT